MMQEPKPTNSKNQQNKRGEHKNAHMLAKQTMIGLSDPKALNDQMIDNPWSFFGVFE